MKKQCAICGAAFDAPPSSKKITCSPACSSEQKRRSHLGKSNEWSAASRERLSAKGETPNLKLGTAAAQQSPIAGPFETNWAAKSWEIASLDSGQRYEFHNLRHFCRDHPDLFAPDHWEKAYAGLRQVQASMVGKTKRTVSRWKNWTLVRPAEEIDAEVENA